MTAHTKPVRRRATGRRRWAIAVSAALVALAGCGDDDPFDGPSVEDGGLPVYVVDTPDVDTYEIAEALHEALDLPDDAEVNYYSDLAARIDGAGHGAAITDRGAGTVGVSYTGPRFTNSGCVDCPPLDATDNIDIATDRSRDILEAIGVDTTDLTFSEGRRSDVDYRVLADVVIEGATFDDLQFRFVWTHDYELKSLTGGLYEIKQLGTVAGRDEADARAQAEQMIGSERTITNFELTYTGTFVDFELIVFPTYLATTDLGTTFTVPAYTN